MLAGDVSPADRAAVAAHFFLHRFGDSIRPRTTLGIGLATDRVASMDPLLLSFGCGGSFLPCLSKLKEGSLLLHMPRPGSLKRMG